MKRSIILALSILTLIGLSCSTRKVKVQPEFKGIHPELVEYVEEYSELALRKGIVFQNNVTMGFSKINDGNVIGYCMYGGRWREINIDSDFWKKAYYTDKKMLMFHELTHCFCGRDHDFGGGERYSSKIWMRLGLERKTSENGYLDDGCPASIMHPMLVSGWCAATHYGYYVNEMFDRCEPW